MYYRAIFYIAISYHAFCKVGTSYSAICKIAICYRAICNIEIYYYCNCMILILYSAICKIAVCCVCIYIYIYVYIYVCVCVCVCVRVCVFISLHGKVLTEQNNKCNTRDQASDAVLRKWFCVRYLRHHVIYNHSRDHQASNCARMSIKLGSATRSKRQLLKLSKN